LGTHLSALEGLEISHSDHRKALIQEKMSEEDIVFAKNAINEVAHSSKNALLDGEMSCGFHFFRDQAKPIFQSRTDLTRRQIAYKVTSK
jgi:hypothetical protein